MIMTINSNNNNKNSINNDIVIHRQVKTNDIISQHFGDLMTPLSRVQMRVKLIYIVEVATDRKSVV